MNFNEMRKYEHELEKLKVQCKNCPTKITFKSRRKELICPNCGTLVYKNKKVEFIEKLKKEMRKSK